MCIVIGNSDSIIMQREVTLLNLEYQVCHIFVSTSLSVTAQQNGLLLNFMQCWLQIILEVIPLYL